MLLFSLLQITKTECQNFIRNRLPFVNYNSRSVILLKSLLVSWWIIFRIQADITNKKDVFCICMHIMFIEVEFLLKDIFILSLLFAIWSHSSLSFASYTFRYKLLLFEADIKNANEQKRK